jgi:hypothetical protein
MQDFLNFFSFSTQLTALDRIEGLNYPAINNLQGEKYQ